jgi:PAS domain S-box-containing protein
MPRPDSEVIAIDQVSLTRAGALAEALRIEGSMCEAHRARSLDDLRAAEERYALAIAGSSDGIWDWNMLTNELFLSERTQRLYGLEPGPTLRPMEAWLEVVKIHPDDIQNQVALVTQFLEGAPPYEAQWRILHPDGIHRWVRVRGLCVRDAQGRPIRGAGSVSDIDQLVRAEAALMQSRRLEATGTLPAALPTTSTTCWRPSLDTERWPWPIRDAAAGCGATSRTSSSPGGAAVPWSTRSWRSAAPASRRTLRSNSVPSFGKSSNCCPRHSRPACASRQGSTRVPLPRKAT